MPILPTTPRSINRLAQRAHLRPSQRDQHPVQDGALLRQLEREDLVRCGPNVVLQGLVRVVFLHRTIGLLRNEEVDDVDVGSFERLRDLACIM